MNTDGSLQGGLFDLSTQAGIMHLLASVRASSLSADKKHDLRDTIFLYTNGGRDQSVKLSLEQKITAYNLTPAPGGPQISTSQKPNTPTFTIGGVRPAPGQFVSRPVQVTSASDVSTPASSPAPTPVSVPVAPAAVSQPQPQPQPVTPAVAPVAATPIPTPPPPAPPVTPAPAPAPTPTPDTSSISIGDSAKYLDRIREIKALVNQRIGNPVNLVDIDPDVGREYMGSLLDAMKKINSGASSIAAMKRLEDAYVSVQKVLDSQATPTPAPTSTPTPTPPPVTSAPAPSSAPSSTPTPVVATPTPAPAPSIPSRPNPVSIERPTSVAPVSNVPLRPATGQLPVSEVAKSPTSTIQSVASKDSVFSSTKLSSLATAPASSARPAAAVDTTDPLFSPDVDKGLDQLLSEWSLFKKSGLFGSGPKGREHPLFKKIAGLQIPLLLAGRFEGATQEIKQSITDYMNGWRYEQGIIYMQGETFERYLRRVIKHILDLQKKASRS